MGFIVGCNYWASNAGTEMWVNWSEDAIKEDLEILSGHGIRVMRVFPNWRDFQPVEPALGGGGFINELRMKGSKLPTNEYYLDDTAMERFERFCDLCDEHGITLIVGLITGWMSGGLFIPPVLLGRNVYTDPLALVLEQKFIRGFVSHFKDRKTIYAWDLGNECNCMNPLSDHYAASAWTGIIANAIRANDPTRPVVSGMHSITPNDGNNCWTIEEQAEYCDILTTHPYPYFVPHAFKDKFSSFRTAMHATCETKYYSEIGKRPGLVEEIGNLGPMFCNYEKAADFVRVNMFSNWANGALGLMWWCANEQIGLTNFPYTRKHCEMELGLIDRNRQPKPVLKEMKRIETVLAGFEFELPQAEKDAVCIVTQTQDQWGAAYMTYCLAKQADLNIGYCFSKDEIPQADTYLMPSIAYYDIIPRENYLELMSRVEKGATLYISNDTAMPAQFEEFVGMRMEDSGMFADNLTFDWEGEKLEFSRTRRFEISPSGAEVLATDSMGIPAVTVYNYGKGKVIYVNFPLETMLLDKNDAFDGELYRVYKKLFEDKLSTHEIVAENKFVSVTRHKTGDGILCVAINYSPEIQKTEIAIKDGYKISEYLYGDSIEELKPFEAVVFRIAK